MKNLDEVQKMYITYDLEHYFLQLKDKARNAVRLGFIAADDDRIKVGSSKIGGCPDLPEGVQWVKNKDRAFAFLAQFNLAEVTVYDIDHMLPDKGMLYFFFDEEGFWDDNEGDEQKNDEDFIRVIFYDGDDTLKRMEEPQNMGNNVVFSACKIKMKAQPELPGTKSGYAAGAVSEADKKKHEKLNRKLYPGLVSKLLGHPNYLQEAMELMLEADAQQISFEQLDEVMNHENATRRKLQKDMSRWHLLFQLDSEEEKSDIIWGDQGTLYFWISREDLKKRNFDKVRFDIQDL
jgi:uncharacterized protein YwqG